jgi:predicted nucleic acid-binding protein
MPMLLDTSILVRLRDQDSPDHPACLQLWGELAADARGAVLATQVLIEYWVVATRPKGTNGLGLDPVDADGDVSRFLKILPCLPEPPDVLVRWRHLVASTGTRGRPAHDARLVAVMDAYGISELVTINAADFHRFSHIRTRLPGDIVSADGE